jgi:Xaa-Pro aminopeptidase
VVTVEPGVYLPERGGVRIEDTLVVPAQARETSEKTEQTPELLTRFPKELAIV